MKKTNEPPELINAYQAYKDYKIKGLTYPALLKMINDGEFQTFPTFSGKSNKILRSDFVKKFKL